MGLKTRDHAGISQPLCGRVLPRGLTSSMGHAPVLLIAYLYPPDNYSGAARPHRFAKYLQRMGRRVTVLAAGAGEFPAVDGNVHRVRGEMEFVRQNDIWAFLERLARKFLFPADFGAVWSVRAAAFGRRLLHGSPRPVVISTSPPLFTHLVALRLKKQFGAVWVADFRDPFAGMPWRRSRRNRWLDPRIERAIFRNADVILANTNSAADIWRKRYPTAAGRIHIIWNGFDPEESLGPLPLPQRDYVVLTHAGDIYGARHPGLLFSSVDRLIHSGQMDPARLRIHLIGPFERSALPDPDLCDRLAALGCVVFTDRVPRAEAQAAIAASDYLLLLDVFHESTAVQVPAKIFDYVRVGRPILACTPRNSPLEFVLGRSGIPSVCLHDDDAPAEIDDQVLRFLALPSTPTPMVEAFRNDFDGARQAESLAALIDAALEARVSERAV